MYNYPQTLFIYCLYKKKKKNKRTSVDNVKPIRSLSGLPKYENLCNVSLTAANHLNNKLIITQRSSCLKRYFFFLRFREKILSYRVEKKKYVIRFIGRVLGNTLNYYLYVQNGDRIAITNYVLIDFN